MTLISSPPTILYLYTDGREIWGSDGEVRPIRIPVPLPALPTAFTPRPPDVLRLLGTAANAPLITALLDHQQTLPADQRSRVQLGTPLVCTRLQAPYPPDEVFTAMLGVEQLAASQGGWHEATPIDHVTYQMTTRVHLPTPAADHEDQLLALLQQHPTWPAISFLANADLLAAARLVALIRDPRWYVDPAHPNRSAKFRSYLGLNDWNVRQVLSGKASSGQYVARCRCVIDTWTGGQTASRPRPPALDAPAYFLWRRAYEEQGQWGRGVLRASELLVNLLHAVWLNAFDPQRELFVPEYFFARKGRAVAVVDQQGAVAAAFRQHVATLATDHKPW